MPTKTAAVFTMEKDSAVAGQDLGRQIRIAMAERPDAVVVFASGEFDHLALLHALRASCQPGVLVGASSAGEFTGTQRGEGSACALAVHSTEMRFAAGFGTDVSKDRLAAAGQVTSAFAGLRTHDFEHRTALVMTDALGGHADELIEQLTIATGGAYEFAGGGAGDDAKFARTHVFCGTQVMTDACVGLEILSHKPVGIGVQHGWQPGSEPLRVTEVRGARLISLDGFPAVEAFEHYAEQTGQKLDRSAPLPFFLHNIIGIETSGGHRLRVPLSIEVDGSVYCAAEIPAGALVHIMKTRSASATNAATEAAKSAQRAVGGKVSAALFFDCVATRLRLGDMFGFELEAFQSALGGGQVVGCNTYGQIARADGQLGGFHNCTAAVLAFPS